MAKKNKIFVPKPPLREKIWRLVVRFLGWIGMAVLLYAGFSFFVDTPLEFRMKRSTAAMRREYTALSERYDSLEMVLDNVVDRDKNVFHILFKSDPYDLAVDSTHWQTYEDLLRRSDRYLARQMRGRLTELDRKTRVLNESFDALERHAATAEADVNHIPAIQPVVNPDLTLLTASFGLRIHPFFRTLQPHNGVDYTVPVGTRVFATADGRVRDILRSNSSSGLSIVIEHGADYETLYAHLDRVSVTPGQTVRRGDIIGLTGNTGLSLSPHLHYEVHHEGLTVDPVHYFFMELNPADYRRIRQIARSGMQSFD